MTAITATGFSRTRLDERVAQLSASMLAIHGADINIDADTIDGQTIGIFAEAISTLDQIAEDVYHQLNPSEARGSGLRKLVTLNGITALEGAFTLVVLSATGTPGAFIPKGSLFKSAVTGLLFESLLDVVIAPAGFIDFDAKAVLMGSVGAPANTITELVSRIYGVVSVTNYTQTATGRLAETDEELRVRRSKSTGTPGIALPDSLYGFLANLANVVQVEVYENYTSLVDANGQAPHSLHSVVLGGSDADIANAVWLKKSNGVTLVGSTTLDTLDSRGNNREIKFSRPVQRPIFVEIDLTTKRGWPADGVAKIKDAIVAYMLANQAIGLDVIQSLLFTPINSVPGSSVTAVRIGFSLGPVAEDDLTIAYAELATFDVANIKVNGL